jgi:hypothetical protein
MAQSPILRIPPPNLMKWRVIFHQKNNEYFFDIVEFPSSLSACEIVSELQAQYLARDRGIRRFVRFFLFRKPMYGTVSLAPVSDFKSTP